MSQEKWLKLPNVGETTTMNSKVVMTNSQINNLWKWAIESPISSMIVGDYTRWCSSLMFYPYKFKENTTNYSLVVGGVSDEDIQCKGDIYGLDYLGYYLGQYYYPVVDSFLSYEPYTKLQVWLPFYGYIDLKIADVQGKYIQFRLFVDYCSGSAQYTVGVNENSVECKNPPYMSAVDDTNTRIIGTYNFQLGYVIPITSTGWAEAFRNTALVALKTTAGLASSLLSEGAGLTKITSKSNTVYTKRNPKTGRQITARTKTVETTKDFSNFESSKRISTTIDSVPNILGAMNISPSIDKSNNSVINSTTCNSIVIITKKVKPALQNYENNSTYNHLLGKPLGEVGLLSQYSGYTECSKVHFENNNFSLATQEEMGMLESIFSNGVIL